jgi:hypothetical protein
MRRGWCLGGWGRTVDRLGAFCQPAAYRFPVGVQEIPSGEVFFTQLHSVKLKKTVLEAPN